MQAGKHCDARVEAALQVPPDARERAPPAG
jgi:hypothetical protein